MAPATTGDAANTGEADLLHGPVGAAAGGDAGGAAEAVDDLAPPGGGGSGKPAKAARPGASRDSGNGSMGMGGRPGMVSQVTSEFDLG